MTGTAAAGALPRVGVVMTIGGLAAFATWFPTTALVVAIPELARVFDVSLAGLGWVPNAYTLTFAASLPLAGRLGDRIGIRRGLIAGGLLFTAATLAAAAAPGFDVMLAMIVVLALGGALTGTLPLALIDHLPAGPSRLRAIGVYSAGSALGQAIGVPLGGALVDSPLGWRSIFWICAPLTLAVVALTALMVHTDPPPGRRSLELATGLAGGGAIALLVVGLMQGPAWGWTDPRVLAAFAAGVLLSGVAVTREVRSPDPVLPAALRRSRRFLGGLGLAGLFNVCLSGTLVLLTFELQNGRGESPTVSGVVLLAFTGTITVVNLLADALSRPLGVRITAAIAMGVTAACLVLMATLPPLSDLGLLIPLLVVAGVGIGLMGPLAAAIALQDVAPRVAASASALFAASALLGATVGVAVTSAVFDGVLGGAAAGALADGDATEIGRGVEAGLLALAIAAAAAVLVALALPRGRRSGSQAGDDDPLRVDVPGQVP